MLDINFIKENAKKVQTGAHNKGFDIDINKVLTLDKQYRELLGEVENLRAKKNEISGEISKLDNQNRTKKIKEAEIIKEKLKEKELVLDATHAEFDVLLWEIPNIPFDDVPIGEDESGNKVLRHEGKPTDFKFKSKDYLEIARQHDLIDIDRASKISGTRFGYLKNQAVQLEFALVNFAMDILVKEGFRPIIPPVMIRPEYMKKLGYLIEGWEDDVYYLEKDDLNLVGTSEQSIVPMFANEVLQEENLPMRFVGFSSCFRREAGSYGKDTKGILRVHQFDKIEMVSFAHPDKSREEHKFLLSMQEKLMKALEIPYRVVQMCTGDTGFPAAEKFDVESWLSGEKKYRETHSTSNTTDFQARRLNTRFKAKDGKTEFVHILNGTAFAVGRMIITIVENHQTEDGGVKIPKELQKYTRFKKI
ncbi:MAG: serine--tRNA ligase [Candidatus Spechtbacteria bacterium RIFCSPLOWO2_02_FULL_38_8]|uniref:Serine--tRNA ligase n=1 Tax=Candidatus Spechtbacteria bacterium RIFCSPLOWO2_02_FULL_38_8 TaxID=1802164 RepID=A0A1G2HKV7_9BACT|nr:MAG: serine--tRNA ligase [Candidatus Spechtbacteria bacterium RIFCSPLOWO2_02_FULL_38_8]